MASPHGTLTCVTGVSGSGKSALVNEILYKAAARVLYRAIDRPGAHDRVEGVEFLDIEMHFLPDVYVTCEVCKGKRYGRETLEVRYKGMNIAEVLDLSVEQARDLFAAHPKIAHILDALIAVGLGYIRLGQSATTLSGGEAGGRNGTRRPSTSFRQLLSAPSTDVSSTGSEEKSL